MELLLICLHLYLFEFRRKLFLLCMFNRIFLCTISQSIANVIKTYIILALISFDTLLHSENVFRTPVLWLSPFSEHEQKIDLFQRRPLEDACSKDQLTPVAHASDLLSRFANFCLLRKDALKF